MRLRCIFALFFRRGAVMVAAMFKAPSSPIRGILFDKDGTLLDFTRTWVPLNRRAAMAAADGDPLLAERLLASAGHDPASDHVIPGSLLAAGDAAEIATHWVTMLPGIGLERLTERVDQIFAASAEEGVPIEAMAQVVRQLHERGYRLGLATSDSEAAAHGFLARCGLDQLFCYIAGWDSGHGRKPEPGMLQAFARAVDLPPKAIAMIGDSPQDMAMGRDGGAGLLVGVLTGTATPADLQPPADVVLPSIADLVALLDPEA